MTSTNGDNRLRLQVYLSHGGIASRREAAQIIEEGRVSVNGKAVIEPGFRVAEGDAVTVDGERVFLTKTHVYLLLNKPEGVICTNKDPEGRPTAVDLVQKTFSQRLYSVGRLDVQSQGLIILTSDGEFADKVMHPRYEIEKEYLVETQQSINPESMEFWREGVQIRGQRYKLKRFHLLSPKKVSLTLTEGKNREIREVFAHFKITIRRLTRIRIGSIRIADLPIGHFRKLSPDEVKELTAAKAPKPRRKPGRAK